MAAIDPGALYQQELANLKQSQTWEEGKLGEGETNLASNVGYAENQITAAENPAYKAEQGRMLKGGLLSSGINAEAKTTLANKFAASRTANEKRLMEGLGIRNVGEFKLGEPKGGTFKREREGIGLTKTKGETGAAQNYANALNAYQAANPTVPVPTGTTGVPGTPGTKPLQFGFNEAIQKEKQGFFKGPSRKIRI